MEPQSGLHAIDWLVIGGFLLFALGVGLYVRKAAGSDKESYFLAGRNLPWWWAGASIAATTFAADTPLVVTAETASRGLSGNWLWLAWIGVHAGAFVFFASKWSRSGVVTDAELVELRYSGGEARVLRSSRAVIYGLVFNGIILGWVLNAMVKICKPFFHWDQWLPGTIAWVSTWWPHSAALGDPSDGLTILFLLGLVGLYSTMGGIRGVIFTDLVQLAIALVGSFWFAWRAWEVTGGRDGLVEGLYNQYDNPEQYLSFFPDPQNGWLEGVGDWMGAGVLEGAPLLIGAIFAGYLFVQSYANFPADGGGYLMQRLNACKSPKDARQASLFFIVLQYVVRVWPWFVVALAALVLIPIGAEHTVFGGQAAMVGDNRELAYPVLMDQLLAPGILGLLITSLLAAFMSTIDTHINWGASYVVNDLYLEFRPEADDDEQVLVARVAVVGFVLLAIAVAFQIDTIGQAWRWVAAIGAALGIPTALRWLWWRVNAAAELGAMGIGLATAVGLGSTEMPYELQLIVISATSLVGMAAGIFFGPRTSSALIEAFEERVEPNGIWPGRPVAEGLTQIVRRALVWLAICAGTIAILMGLHRGLIRGQYLLGGVVALVGAAAIWGGSTYLGIHDGATTQHPAGAEPPAGGNA